MMYDKDVELKDLKLFNVEIETDFTVLARDEKDAERIVKSEGIDNLFKEDFYFTVIPVKKCTIKTPNGILKEYYNYNQTDVFGYDHLHSGDIKEIIAYLEELEKKKEEKEEADLQQMKLELE